MSETAAAVISATQLAPGNFQYNITLADTGTTPLGTFWFAWVPGQDYLDTPPTSVTSPPGWTGLITNQGPSDGFAIQWHVLSTSAELTPGNSLAFSFTSADTPAQVFGNSSHFPNTPVVTSFVYSGQPFSDAGFEFQSMVAAATTITATTPGQVVPLTSGNNLVFVAAPGDTIAQSGGANTIISNAGAMTINGTGGSSLIFDTAGGDLVNEAPASAFFGAPGGRTSMINASAGGSDTIFAGSSVIVNGSAGANSLFVGGSGAATVVAAASATLFGGTGGGIYAPGSAGFFFFGGGAADTITGGVASPTVWGNSNERLSAVNTAGHGVFVAFGENDSIDASAASGGNTFIAVDQALAVPSGTFSGNTTLVGSSVGTDTFGIFSEGGTPPPAHTITIENWQASDVLSLGNYGAADMATANAALAGAAPGAGASFTLSDQTTIVFVGNHPAAAA